MNLPTTGHSPAGTGSSETARQPGHWISAGTLRLAIVSFAIFTLSLSIEIASASDDNELNTPLRALVERVSATYGVDELARYRALEIFDRATELPYGQSYSPALPDLRLALRHSVFDLDKEQGSSEVWFGEAYGLPHMHTRTVVSDGTSGTADYLLQFVDADVSLDFYEAFGTVLRFSDTALAYQLVHGEHPFELTDAATHFGAAHDVVTLTLPRSPALNIHINRRTGWLTRAVVTGPVGDVVFHFAKHDVTSDGIGYAREAAVFLNGQLRRLVSDRSVNVRTLSEDLEFEKNLQRQPTPLPVAESTVTPLGDQTFLVSLNGTSSAIYTTERYLIVTGTGRGLSARLATYREKFGDLRPVRYAIVTHHHGDQLAGIEDAVSEGATLLLSSESQTIIQETLSSLKPEVETIGDRLSLDGLSILNIATVHAADNLIVFDTESGSLFQAHHHTDPWQDYLQPVDTAGHDLFEAIQREQLPVQLLLSANSPKILSFEDFSKSAKQYAPRRCPSERAICRDLDQDEVTYRSHVSH